MPSKDENQRYIVLPTELLDAEAVWTCGDRAFGPDSFRSYIFPQRLAHLTSREELAEWRVERLRKLIRAGDIMHFKCVPEGEGNEGKVVGYAGWYRPGHFKDGKGLAESAGLGGAKKGNVEDGVKVAPESDLSAQGGKPPGVEGAGEAEGTKEELPACMDVALHNECMEIMDRERKKIWGDDANYWCMTPLSSAALMFSFDRLLTKICQTSAL